MKKRSLTAAALLSMLLASAAVAATKPFTVVAVQNSESANGKTFKFEETLSAGKKVVAHDTVKCLETSQNSATCTATFTFVSGGTISAKGKISFAGSDAKIPITSGTGKYAGAKGVLHLRDLSSTQTQLTFDLS